ITAPNNPLTARVMSNRIWAQLTGVPIVETMDNFGLTGLPPTHPELLDYLAIRLIESGWSLKTLVREIVLSETYQLAATYHEGNYSEDPGNLTHWRASPRQLDAEALRDQMLVVSGTLDRVRPENSMAHLVGDSRLGDRGRQNTTEEFDTSQFRGRSVYLPILRDALPDELGLFDAPDPLATISRRTPTNVAPQSLHLMNSDLVYEQARAMAQLLEKHFSTPRDRASNAFLLTYNRPATAAEVERSLQFLEVFEPGTPTAGSSPPTSEPGLPSGPSMMSGSEQATGGKGKGKGGKAKGAKGGKGKGRDTAPEEVKAESVLAGSTSSIDQIKLTALCQALMMSAEFRTIH
ncbi:MAG: DUF1553 domain-containing protein, partial [Verrucomicrobiota bacterium]